MEIISIPDQWTFDITCRHCTAKLRGTYDDIDVDYFVFNFPDEIVLPRACVYCPNCKWSSRLDCDSLPGMIVDRMSAAATNKRRNDLAAKKEEALKKREEFFAKYFGWISPKKPIALIGPHSSASIHSITELKPNRLLRCIDSFVSITGITFAILGITCGLAALVLEIFK